MSAPGLIVLGIILILVALWLGPMLAFPPVLNLIILIVGIGVCLYGLFLLITGRRGRTL